jgi:hypothetical protein
MPSVDVPSVRPATASGRDSVLLSGPFSSAIAVLGCGLFALSLPYVPDHGYQFYLARELLGGARLYVDVAAADMHPPLFTWFAAGLEAIARLVGTSGLAIYSGFVAVCAALTLYSLWRIGPRSPFVLMSFVLVLLPLSGPSLGQGEHLTLLFALPYLAMRASTRPAERYSPAVRVLIAVAAAFGFAMKPYFALVWIGTELYCARTEGMRSLLRLENIVIAVCLALYVVATALITPEFFEILPWLMKLYPRFRYGPFVRVLADPRLLLLIGALLALRLRGIEPEWKRFADILAIAAVAMYCAVLLQKKGWAYHWYPVIALSLVVLAIAVKSRVERFRILLPVAAVFAVVWMNSQVSRTTRILASTPTFLADLLPITEKHAQGRPIVALAQNIQAGFPLVNYAGVDWASPYAHLWMIPAIYDHAWYDGARWRYRDAGEWRVLEQQMFDRIWTTIEQKRPSLMLVQLPLTNGFNTREYFSTDPRFRALFDHATLVATVGLYWVVRLNYGSGA